ncbi:DUF6615 family protein [Streptomyces sp. CA-251387]|uniref:DUF6615 family protein n=1 Tax=Streptomyces sp. CA-251387 TaxID=3240064 RepID=UPI003D9333BC
MSLCLCGEEIADRFVFCPHCGVELRGPGQAAVLGVSPEARSVCRTLRACATRTFERLALDHFTGSASGEEMYTQLNLGDLQRLHSDRIVVREFHRRQEARNGADWEWWFHTAGRGFGLRVQAKRAKRGGGYDLEHVVRTTGERQSELLVRDALAAGCLPVYVLYNHRNWVPRSPTGLVVDCRHGRGSPTQLGCTIVSALTVQAVLRHRPIRASYVRDRSVPWHRVLCDAPDTGRSGLEAAHAAVEDLHRRGSDDLRAAAQAEVDRLRTSTRRDAAARPGPTGGTGGGSARPRRSTPAAAAWGREPLDDPVYPGLDELAGHPLSRLPDRVKSMIRERGFEPPDARAAGVVLVDLTDV